MSFTATARRLAALALAVAIAGLPWGSLPVRAAEDSNVPGIPLPGSPVTGQLGGPIYDHVYSIDVPPASIILLSLTGEPGTDFDLYLFDSTATSVYVPDGQVAFSTGPTATESISYPTIGGGRYYVDLSGATDVQGAFRLVVSIQSDTTPPNAELRLNRGAPATNDPTVQVSLLGSDDLSGVGDMQLSLDGKKWGPFVAYTPTFLWVFDGADGTRQLWARVRDRAGNVSDPATAKITIDTVAPTVLARSPEPNGTAAGLRPAIRVTFSEPIDPRTWIDHGLIVQHAGGQVVGGEYTWDEATRTGTFVPTSSLVAGEPVACAIGDISDPAGNALAPIGTWLITPLLTHTITVEAAPRVVTVGARATIKGQVDGPVYGPMTLEVDAGGGWQPLTAIHPASNGAFAASVVPGRNTQYRVRAGASQLEAASTSPTVRVLARRGVAFLGAGATAGTSKAGGTVRLTATLTPPGPPVEVTLTVNRYDAVRRAWVASATLRATSTSAGRAAFAWRPTRTGAYRLRLTTPSTPVFANGISSLTTWTVP